jgi:predicted RNase H-like nuclease (RuvC/YqgF family)
MIDSYGVNNEYHAWLGIDPGVTTGWALVADDEKVLGHGTLDEDSVKSGLDRLIRGVHGSSRTLTVVVEKMPAAGKMSELASRLERVRRDVSEVVVDVYDLPVQVIPPGEWKTSRVAKTSGRLDARTQHERDAITMTRYAIQKEHRRGR